MDGKIPNSGVDFSAFSNEKDAMYGFLSPEIIELQEKDVTSDAYDFTRPDFSGTYDHLDSSIPLSRSISLQPEIVKKSTDFKVPNSIEEYYIDPYNAHSVVKLTVHRACGLKGLAVEYLKACDPEQRTHIYNMLEIGVNSFVQLILFPTDKAGEEKSVETNVIPVSFTPIYEYNSDIIMESVDTDILKWMHKGGAAQGRIWHQSLSNGESFLLGKFSINLNPLLVRKEGIQRRWYPIISSKDNSISPAAVEVSLSFRNGYELGQLDLISAPNTAYQSLRIQIHMKSLIFETEDDLNPCDTVFVKWSHPKEDGNNGAISEQWEYSKSHKLQRIEGRNIYNSDLNYHFDSEFALTSEILQMLTIGHEFQIFLKSPDIEFHRHLGSVFVDTIDLLASTRSYHRSKTSNLIKPCLIGRYQVINPSSSDMGSSEIDVKIEFDLITDMTKSLFGTSLRKTNISQMNETTGTRLRCVEKDLINSGSGSTRGDQNANPKSVDVIEPSNISLEEQAHFAENSAEIELFISVIRALDLPLTDDPFASSISSPFVKQGEVSNTPPNAFVTFTSDMGDTYQSMVIAAQNNPRWNFSQSTFISREKRNLQYYKSTKDIIFYVWHSTESSSKKYRSESIDTMEVMDDMRVLLGKTSVTMSPLFSGLLEINGWYPILDESGNAKGQLLLQIRPSEPLSFALKAFEGEKKSVMEYEPKKVTMDTWVWTGKEWKNNLSSDQLPDVDDVFTKSTTYEPKKSLFDTLQELDILNSKMRTRLDASYRPVKNDISRNLDIIVNELADHNMSGPLITLSLQHPEEHQLTISDLELPNKTLAEVENCAEGPGITQILELLPFTFNDIDEQQINSWNPLVDLINVDPGMNEIQTDHAKSCFLFPKSNGFAAILSQEDETGIFNKSEGPNDDILELKTDILGDMLYQQSQIYEKEPEIDIILAQKSKVSLCESNFTDAIQGQREQDKFTISSHSILDVLIYL